MNDETRKNLIDILQAADEIILKLTLDQPEKHNLNITLSQ
jgi:hypothetical protein